jgi:hypothetical protein
MALFLTGYALPVWAFLGIVVNYELGSTKYYSLSNQGLSYLGFLNSKYYRQTLNISSLVLLLDNTWVS